MRGGMLHVCRHNELLSPPEDGVEFLMKTDSPGVLEFGG